MRSTVLFLMSAAIFSTAALAEEGDLSSRSDAIINGQQCPMQTHPATVAILIDGEVNVLGQQHHIKSVICTGTLIAPDVVLTAAHCVDLSMLTSRLGNVRKEKYAISFEADLVALYEETSTLFPPDAVYATRKVRHPKFSISSMVNVDGPGEYHDVALLFLERPVMHVQPALVVTAQEATQLQEGSVLEISGFGMSTSQPQTSAPPKGSIGRKLCATSFVAELGATEMQVGLDVNSSRKCHGDSGGPSYLDVETSHDVKQRLVGVTSHAYDERDCNFGGVDTRVDAYLDWIEAELVRGCNQGRRRWCAVPGLITPDYLDDGKTLPLDDGLGGDAAGGCGCAGGPPGLLALVATLLVSRRRSRHVVTHSDGRITGLTQGE